MDSEKTPLAGLQSEIKKLLEKGVADGVFPAAAAGVAHGLGKEKKEMYGHCGNAALYPEKRKLDIKNFFDLASLTKPLATTMAALCLIKDKKIDLDEKIPSLFEKSIAGKIGKVTARQLLSHCSGLPGHREYFHILKKIGSGEKKEFVENLILSEPLEYEPGTAALYSDLGFILLGRIIEIKAGRSLEEFVEEKIFRPLHLEEKIFYNPLPAGRKNVNKKDFVATEDCPWRKEILCGAVHDDNCYALGGVAGHSGLFGNIEGVTTYAAAILGMWKGVEKHPNIQKEDLENFLSRQQTIPGSTWALGFDTPAKTGSSSGTYFSHKSVGHLGFTGTSFWIDPEKDVVIVLLSNRVHPYRDNSKIKQYRPYFHDRLIEKLSSLKK